MDGQKIWASILGGIKTLVSASTFKTWFAGSFALESQENLLVVGVKNNFIKEQLENRFLPIILASAKKNGFSQVKITFRMARREETEKSTDGEPLFSGVAPVYFNAFRKVENLNPGHTFENFVVGASNNLAFLASQQAVSQLGKIYNPLFIYGPTGVGKTHLLQACGSEVLNKYADAKVLYVSCEAFTNDFLQSLVTKTTSEFRAKYRRVDLLLVDDVQFLGGKEGTQDEFFYTFNELYLAGKQIILAADKHPSQLSRIRERLVSRFLGGMTVDIAKPDLELRIAILKTKSLEKGIALDDEVIGYIAEVCQNNARELEGVLIQVLSVVKFSGGGVTLDAIRQTVEKNRALSKPLPTSDKIMECVSKHFRISIGDLCGPKRKAHLVRARQLAMYLLRQELNLPLESIGDICGDRDHSTVIYSIEKVEREILANRESQDQLARIRLSF